MPQELKERIRAHVQDLVAKAEEDVRAGRVVGGPAAMEHLRKEIEAGPRIPRP